MQIDFFELLDKDAKLIKKVDYILDFLYIKKFNSDI